MSTSKPQTREPLNTRQRSILMAFYNQNPYPSASERHQLVQLTGRTVKQIQDWFSNRRRNDPKLVSAKCTSASLPPPVVPLQPSYYCPPAPPSTSHICSCCYYTQSPPMMDRSFYPPCTTNYYPPAHSFHL